MVTGLKIFFSLLDFHRPGWAAWWCNTGELEEKDEASKFRGWCPHPSRFLPHGARDHPHPPPPAWGVPQGRLKTGYPKITAIAQDLTIMQWGPAPPPCRLSPRRNIMPTKLQHLGLGWFLPGCLQGRGQPRDSSGAGTRLHRAGVTHK